MEEDRTRSAGHSGAAPSLPPLPQWTFSARRDSANRQTLLCSGGQCVTRCTRELWQQRQRAGEGVSEEVLGVEAMAENGRGTLVLAAGAALVPAAVRVGSIVGGAGTARLGRAGGGAPGGEGGGGRGVNCCWGWRPSLAPSPRRCHRQ